MANQLTDAGDGPKAHLPEPYVTNYTSETPTLNPLIESFLRAGILLGLEWTTLVYIEHAPLVVKLASFITALAVLAILEKRDWLRFKGRSYFKFAISISLAIYLAVSAYALLSTSHEPDLTTNNPVATTLQSELKTVIKERDAARQERDAAIRNISSPPSQPTVPPTQPNNQTPPLNGSADDPNDYPPLTRERQRALVTELTNAKDVFSKVVFVCSAGPHNEAGQYRNELTKLFDRAGIRTDTGVVSMDGPDQTGVMLAVADLNNPTEPAKKILDILTNTGFRPKVIQAAKNGAPSDFYIFIGPRPL